MAEYEATDLCAADKVRIRFILHHERHSVDNGSATKPFDDKLIFWSATIVKRSDLYDTILDQDETISYLIGLANFCMLRVRYSLHRVD